MPESYDLVVVGTGFGSSFFLNRYLEHAGPGQRVLVLEKGIDDSLQWQQENRRHSSLPRNEHFTNQTPQKPWIFTLGLGGGSNCWWGCTPRFLPSDFEMRTRYGVSNDWPVSYDELEAYYLQAEHLMAIAGDSTHTPFRRSGPYPLPAHVPSTVDKKLLAAYSDYYLQPTARASKATSQRPRCCGNGICDLCPIGAKFTIKQGLKHIFQDPRVTVKLDSPVLSLDHNGSTVSGVNYESAGKVETVVADVVALGANAIFNPHILLNSGVKQNMLGKNLNEQEGIVVEVDLADIDNYDGSTSITGHGYAFYDGDHRKDYAAALFESWNTVDSIRTEQGKWRKRVVFKGIFEEIPQIDNLVSLDEKDKNKPVVIHGEKSAYTQRGVEAFERQFPDWLSKVLPVEDIRFSPNPRRSEAHVLGTTMMGSDPETSVVDKHLVHHQLRNLVVLGSSVFASCPPANPSLTISALSLMAADHLMGKTS